MFHLVSYKWFSRTQYIPRFGGVLQERGEITWRVSDCEDLVGEVNHTTECVTDFLVLLMLNGQFYDPIQTIWVGKGYS